MDTMGTTYDLNILVPMAGAGKRFRDAGYDVPKFMIDVVGQPMIARVIANMPKGRFIFLVQREHLEKFPVETLLEEYAPGSAIIPVDGLTEGAACTCLLARDLIDSDRPLLIANCDQLMGWDPDHFIGTVGSDDGAILTFTSNSPKNSYVNVCDGFVTEVAEKDVISDIATCGVYYYRKGKYFVEGALEMISKGIRTNGEFYVAPAYNEILDWARVSIYWVDAHHPIGTPEDLTVYLEEVHGRL